jgi:N-acetylglucosamine kinase-like BadF-type ATPase
MLPPEVRGPGPLRVEKLYQTSCGSMGPAAVSEGLLEIGEIVSIGEGPCGVLAGLAADTGILTLSGTGSDSFYVRDGKRVAGVGGFGPLLGDEGSGFDMGLRTLQAAIRADDGRGPATLLRDYIFEDYGLKDRMWELVYQVYDSPDSRKPVARATYTLARAAKDGDAVALDILERGARRLAGDTMALLRRIGQDETCTLPVTVSGGVWKIHPLIWRNYRRLLLEKYPHLQLQPPHFEPVVAGVIHRVLQQEGTVSPARLAQLKADFAPYVLDGFFAEDE